MDFILLFFIAVLCGLFFTYLNLPSLVGFLFAGYVCNFFSFQTPVEIEFLSEIGINLLLFTIGLKLNPKNLLKKEVLGTTILLTSVFTFLSICYLHVINPFFPPELRLSISGVIFISFALSLSSTVYSVKILQNKGDLTAFYGQIVLGILIIQDVFATIFLAFDENSFPGYWSFLILIIPFLRPLIYKFLDFSGHDELLVFSGIVLALGFGAKFFEVIGLKPELGALIIGIVVSQHKKADELSKSLFSLKEFFLVGFFLSIGLKASPTLELLAIAFFLCILLPFKGVVFFLICNYFSLRIRTSLFTSFSLITYSEFALIISAIAANNKIISIEWVIIVSLAISISFVIASPFGKNAEKIYEKFSKSLRGLQSKKLHQDDIVVDVGNAQALVIGMGRVGVGAYDEIKATYDDLVVGIEHNPKRVRALIDSGRKVLCSDADDFDFWLNLKNKKNLEIIILAMPEHQSNLAAAQQINHIELTCKVSAVVRFEEEEKELSKFGVTVFNIYSEAGAGLVKHSLRDNN